MISSFLRNHPYLKPVNLYNLYDRLLKVSNNSLLLLYNITRDTYEIHSIKSFQYDGDSLNAVLEDDMLNGWLVHDYLANNITKFGTEVQSERELCNNTLDSIEDRGMELLSQRALKTVETMVGREI